MKFKSMMPVPWDMVVFLTITTVGLGFSVQQVQHSKVNRILDSPQSADMAEMLSSTPSGPVLDLGCLERKLGTERVAGQENKIRVKGKFCNLTRKAMRAFDGIKIKNLTNGREGTIFFQGMDSSFITDHMILENGKNVIKVEWRESPKVATREYVTEIDIKD